MWIVHVVLIVGAALMVFPFVWQLLTSFKTLSDSVQVPPSFLPREWVFTNFAEVFDSMPFGQMFLNSVLLTVGRTVGQVALCTMAGYAFARIAFPGRNALFVVFLSVLMVPSQLYLLPQYEIIQALGWLNTLQALIVPGIFSAFGTFLMRQFFLSMPAELEEAARIDGANPWQTFWRIMVPLAKPGIIALVVFTVLWSWNDLLWPLIVTTDPAKMPLSVGLSQLVGIHGTDYPVLMAGALLATLPMLVTFMILQRQFIQGIAFSGTKG
ncbi:carbohydrate ABC transporter permease [Microbacterium sp. HSID17254]|nr:sugar ABC transporter permease [Microbacterium sp. PAMC 28756]KYJ97195.1 sugar ABC transporter permease [Microbacterium sp. CH1]MPT14825.1 carbohydrate ABC transporter permease [Microbacterium sp.]OSP09035.1 sugar ABC transporter permease [Microbacterium sp. LEMMJ01]PMC05398.1 sn-glycerol-3-phosphate ABC transporter permease UgpE [Microbacterium sp. UMB0228]RUQ04923.1 carbohydrate ABC transporter permease [Microbacterium sp. HSID17254]